MPTSKADHASGAGTAIATLDARQDAGTAINGHVTSINHATTCSRKVPASGHSRAAAVATSTAGTMTSV